MEFDDAAGYDAYMSRWTRLAGSKFLEWFAAPLHARWLEIGCGTGAFTSLIVEGAAPRSVTAIDRSPEQIAAAKRPPASASVTYSVADAQSRPYADGAFDVAVSALTLNFIHDRSRAVAEVRRVCRRGGISGAYVWDVANERNPSGMLARALRDLGVEVPATPGAADASPERLAALYAGAGFGEVATTSFEVSMRYRDFDALWQTQTPAFHRTTRLLVKLPAAEQARLRASVQAQFAPESDGSVRYSAVVNAVKARAS